GRPPNNPTAADDEDGKCEPCIDARGDRSPEQALEVSSPSSKARYSGNERVHTASHLKYTRSPSKAGQQSRSRLAKAQRQTHRQQLRPSAATRREGWCMRY